MLKIFEMPTKKLEQSEHATKGFLRPPHTHHTYTLCPTKKLRPPTLVLFYMGDAKLATGPINAKCCGIP